MKQRLLVMNGQKLLQTEQGGQWAISKVEKAGAIKPGIYNIHLAAVADKTKSYDGTVVHSDRDLLYQQVGQTFIKHQLSDFATVPEIGSNSHIKYDNAKAVATPSSIKLGRRQSR